MRYKMAANFNWKGGSCEFSSVVSVKEFKEQVMETIGREDIERTRTGLDNVTIAEEMEIAEETLAELQEVCSPDNLKCPNEPHIDNISELLVNISEVNLATIQALSVDNHKNGVNPFQEKNYIALSKKLSDLEEENKTNGCEVIDGPEVALSVALYHPATLKRAQEFLCIGRQKLTHLRDKIYCPADSIVPGEHSENPDFTTVTTAKDICPSGFMFIEGVFYNDMRDPLSRDYSKVIMDWVNKDERYKLPRLGVYTSKKMEDTKFEDLNIKLGFPYVYCHQGNCEHLVIFRDLRMLHADDPKSVSNYPFQMFRHRPMRQRCCICEIYSARWLTRDDPLMSEDPSLFCEKCFKSLHYKNNQKVYTFNAYQYAGEQYW